MYRSFTYPNYQVKQDNKFLEITTKYFRLTYVKEMPFTGSKVDPMKNLKITLLSSKMKMKIEIGIMVILKLEI